MNEDRGLIFRLYDEPADKWSPAIEYPTVKVAVRSCANLKIPPAMESGEYQLWLIAERVGNMITNVTQECVWTNESVREAMLDGKI